MSCRKYERLIVYYLGNELKEPEAQRLEEHIKACEDCRKSLAEYRSILAETKELRAPVYTDEFWTAKLNELRNRPPQRQRRALLKPVILSASALAVIAVLAVKIFGPGENRMAESPIRNQYAVVLNELPYPEDTLLKMVDYIDDESAEKLLNIILENNLMSAHIR